MKFLREMMGKKPVPPHEDGEYDVIAPLASVRDGATPEADDTGEEVEDLFASLASIQARIQDVTQSDARGTPTKPMDTEKDDLYRAEPQKPEPQNPDPTKIEEIADLVADIQKPATNSPASTNRQPEMATETAHPASMAYGDQIMPTQHAPACVEEETSEKAQAPETPAVTACHADETPPEAEKVETLESHAEHGDAPARTATPFQNRPTPAQTDTPETQAGTGETDISDLRSALTVDPVPTSVAPNDSAPSPVTDTADAPVVEVPAPAAGRAGRRAGRTKTRLLGFGSDHSAAMDPIDMNRQKAPPPNPDFPVGWVVVADGPGRGASYALHVGVSSVGRGEDQAIKLDFGDSSISRNNHAAIAYDDEQRRYFLGHGGKANLVRLNGLPVLTTEELTTGDMIRIGETTLRFVGMCGDEFDWGAQSEEELDDAAIA